VLSRQVLTAAKFSSLFVYLFSLRDLSLCEMGRRKSAFAKNPNDVRHFRLVSRSARDPKIVDPDATPNVLEPFVPVNIERRRPDVADEKMRMPESFARGVGADVLGFEARGEEAFDQGTIFRPNDEDEEFDEDDEDEAAIEQRLAHLDGDCYFPRDGYNYDQHLKNVSKLAKSSAEGSSTVILATPGVEAAKPSAKTKVEAFQLNEAIANDLTPVITEDKPDADELGDEEIAAMRALEFDDEYDEADDNLLEELLPSGLAVPEREVLWGKNSEDRDHLPDLELLKKMHAQCFISSGPGQEGMVDDDGEENAEQLEQVLNDEYGDEEIGPMEDEEIEGTMNAEDLEDILDEYIHDKEEEQEAFRAIREPLFPTFGVEDMTGKKELVDDQIRVTSETRALIEQHYTYMDDEDTESGEGSDEDESKNWDCESVLSTLSNVSNRPGKIGRIHAVKKPAAKPAVVQECPDAEARAEADDESEDDVVEIPDVCNERRKDETPEEKKARKASVKEAKRICRTMKTESKKMYKQEELKMAKAATMDVRSKVRVQRL